MALTITVRTEGLDGLQVKLDRYQGVPLNRALAKASLAAARTLVGPMRAAAPNRTGAMRRSVKATRATRRDKPGAIVGPRIWYRHFVIGGTSRGVRANPFVTRTAESNAESTARKFRDVLHDELTR
jgi:hypothetical protein